MVKRWGMRISAHLRWHDLPHLIHMTWLSVLNNSSSSCWWFLCISCLKKKKSTLAISEQAGASSLFNGKLFFDGVFTISPGYHRGWPAQHQHLRALSRKVQFSMEWQKRKVFKDQLWPALWSIQDLFRESKQKTLSRPLFPSPSPSRGKLDNGAESQVNVAPYYFTPRYRFAS